VADESSNAPRPFDVETVKHLIRLMRRHDLSEIDLREGELRIRLRRGSDGQVALPGPRVTRQESSAPPAAPGEAPQTTKTLLEIKSPGPGTFYIAPNPGAEPFVRKGSRVSPTTVVGLLEAMKLFTDIVAECSGAIVETLVENQQPVEYNQVLFRVDPAG
jgi:acetyl-CoA carboxylase biotin carboxyl carrier protein